MDIEFYSSPGCTWCIKTERLLQLASLPYTKHIVGEDISFEDVRVKYPEAGGYPVIIVDGKFIAGGIHQFATMLVKKGLVSSSMLKND